MFKRLVDCSWCPWWSPWSSSVVVTWFAYLRPLRDRWGVVPDETERTLPGDDLVPDATLVETRGITIDAPPDRGLAVAGADGLRPRRLVQLRPDGQRRPAARTGSCPSSRTSRWAT